jgi:resuscitation-promoting factor RpfB
MTWFKKILAALTPVLLGAGMIAWWLLQPVTIVVDGRTILVRTGQLTPGGVLADGLVVLYPGDRVQPGPDTLYLHDRPIHVYRNAAFNISVDGQVITTYSTEKIPGNVLASLGLWLFPGDELWADGSLTTADGLLSDRLNHTLQLNRAHPVQIGARTLASPAKTALQVFWQTDLPYQGYRMSNPPQSAAASIQLLPPVTLAGSLASSGNSLAEAVAWQGLAPQGLDRYDADLSAAAGTPFTILRIREDLTIQQQVLGFTSSSQMDDTLDLDQTAVVQSGEYGLSMQLTRTRMQDGVEIDKKVESETVIKAPQNEITGVGTKIAVKSTTVDGVAIEYYRAVSAYATSYSPCNVGSSGCSNTTASGGTVHKGVIAVKGSWYYSMVGQQVYIPGYGYATIEDMGGGIPGTPWVDLAYSDDEFVAWHSWVTIYFLTPVPGNILYDLN